MYRKYILTIIALLSANIAIPTHADDNFGAGFATGAFTGGLFSAAASRPRRETVYVKESADGSSSQKRLERWEERLEERERRLNRREYELEKRLESYEQRIDELEKRLAARAS